MALGNSRGQAVVLDNPRDPLAIYQQEQQRDATNDYRLRQLRYKQAKDQSTDINKLIPYKYHDAPDMFKQWGQDAINEAQAKTFDVLQNSPNADPIALQQQLSGPRGDAQKKLAYAIETSNLFKQADEAIKGTKGVDPIRARENLTKLYNRDPTQIDRELLENFASMPMNLDVNGLVAESVKDIKDQYNVDSTGKPTNTMFGQIMTIENNKKRFTDIEKTMDYILGGDDVTDIGQTQSARGNQIVDGILGEMATERVGDKNNLRAQMDEYKRLNSIFDTPPRTPEERARREQLNDQVRSRLRPMLEQLDQKARGVKIQRLGNFPKEGSKTIGEEDYRDRINTINAVKNPYNNKGELTEAAQQAAARLRSGKLGVQNITDVSFKKGGRVLTPEGQKMLADAIINGDPNASNWDLKKLEQYTRKTVPHDKAVISIKVGTMMGETSKEAISIDLSDPGAEALLNGILTGSGNEKKILYPDLLKFKSGKGATQYLDSDEEDGYLDE